MCSTCGGGDGVGWRGEGETSEKGGKKGQGCVRIAMYVMYAYL